MKVLAALLILVVGSLDCQASTVESSVSESELTPMRIGGREGVVDADGRTVVEPIYDHVGWFTEDRAVVLFGERYGAIDALGVVVVPIKYRNLSHFSDGLANVHHRLWVDKDGVEYRLPRMDTIGSVFSGGLLQACPTEQKCGYLDTDFEFAIPPIYNRAEPFSDGFARVWKGDRQFYIDVDGQEILDAVGSAFSEGFASFDEGENCGYIDREGTQVIAPLFDECHLFSEGRAAVLIEDAWWFIDPSGDRVGSMGYDDVFGFSNGLALVERSGLWGYIDLDGTTRIPAAFSRAWSCGPTTCRVEREGEMLLIDHDGQQIFPTPDAGREK